MTFASTVFWVLALGLGFLAGFFLKSGILIVLGVVLILLILWLLGVGKRQPAEGGLAFGILSIFTFIILVTMGITAIAVRPQSVKTVAQEVGKAGQQTQSFFKKYILR